MSVLVGDQLFVKGAPDAVFPKCVVPVGATDAVQTLANRGLRILAVASRRIVGARPASADDAEQQLALLGLVAIEDPPRRGAAAAIAACRRAGIRVAMITGDHPATARAIAQEVGLLGGDELVIVGRELPTDDDVLGALLDREGCRGRAGITRAEVADRTGLGSARSCGGDDG